MGQKVNPHGLRVGVIKDWDSRWFAKDKDFGDTLVEDYNLRKHLKKTAVRSRRSEDRNRTRRFQSPYPYPLRKAWYGHRQGRR